MHYCLRGMMVLCTLLWVFASPGSNAARLRPPSYDVVALGPPGASARAMGLNGAGQVVGVLTLPGQGQQAFLDTRGRVRRLGVPAGASGSVATAVNDAGQVVVTAHGFPDRTHSFLWAGGRTTDLGSLGTGPTIARGINAQGETVGSSLTAKHKSHAFLYARGTMRDLGTLPGGNESAAWAVNDQGQVVGEAGLQPDQLEFGATHAFLWRPDGPREGRMADLGALPGYTHSRAVAVNNRGQAVGSAGRGELTGKYASGVHAVLWANGKARDLGTLSGRDGYARHVNVTEATAINDRGQIVGSALVGRGVSHALLWQNGTVRDLNTLIPQGRGYELDSAVGINSRGQIICNGLLRGQKRGFYSTVFLLTPRGEPARHQ